MGGGGACVRACVQFPCGVGRVCGAHGVWVRGAWVHEYMALAPVAAVCALKIKSPPRVYIVCVRVLGTAGPQGVMDG